ncbi:hypothetical protein FHR61_002089 [Xanthomonas arboricola]|uniref:Uncharacterized protein n=1 Tax=Xanthomonas cannabis TaxID=1885674 RepID=A0ABR6JMX8_9XANT|nr:hypothetical protein [Xanthomonas cannabis]MBB5522243.1 hypothetical protein [Xanthomonas cannabis]
METEAQDRMTQRGRRQNAGVGRADARRGTQFGHLVYPEVGIPHEP